jgi:hypothetical protein
MATINSHLNRGNIYVKQADGGIYLYTQNRGDKLPQILKMALLRGKSRWGNTPVMTRIIFGEMVQNDVLNMDGFAISTQLSDNDHYLLVVDDAKERVGLFSESGQCFKVYSYEAYVELADTKLTWALVAGGYTPDHNEYEGITPLDPNQIKDAYTFPGDVTQSKPKKKTDIDWKLMSIQPQTRLNRDMRAAMTAPMTLHPVPVGTIAPTTVDEPFPQPDDNNNF